MESRQLTPTPPLRWWLPPLLLWPLLALLGTTPLWQVSVEGRAFDLLTTLRPPQPPSDTVLVVLDEPSFAEVNQQYPWPRALHADLLRALQRAGAQVIAFDIIFAEPSRFGPEDDAALAEAIQEAGRVVLAGAEEYIERPQWLQYSRIEPLPLLVAAGASVGLATIEVDGDGVVRSLPLQTDSFSRQIAQLTGRPLPPPVAGQQIQYFGPPGHFSRVSYYQALDPEHYLPPHIFQGKRVLVGLDLRNTVQLEQRAADLFETPFTLTSQRYSAGVEIHATILDNLLYDTAIDPLAVPTQLTLLALTLLLSGYLNRHWEPTRSSLSAALLIAALLTVALLLLYLGRLWLPPGLPLLGVILPYLLQGLWAVLQERRQRLAIARAFSHYLSPAMVERLQREPQRLQLGGELRPMTLLFLDIRGFTTLSERYQENPQALTRLINRFLTPMSAEILREDGTIDKYIGDCIMAFWNAPLDEPHHPLRACHTALAMVEAMHRFNRELVAEGEETPVQLDVGIGINSGPCVVGNMGSEQRFDYSVLGDTVNLAARLEAVSKLYGTRIVLGAQTAMAVAGQLAVVEIDLIAVKGKQQAVPIYTLLGDGQMRAQAAFQTLAAATDALLRAYRAGDWEAALAALAEGRASGLLPGLFQLYQQRIEHYRATPPGPEWNGVYIAESK